mgnify:CR=1 FL=1
MTKLPTRDDARVVLLIFLCTPCSLFSFSVFSGPPCGVRHFLSKILLIGVLHLTGCRTILGTFTVTGVAEQCDLRTTIVNIDALSY